MPLLPKEKELSAAHSVILEGPLGIAEDHTNPKGRELVKRLVEAGVVNRLFIEMPSYRNDGLKSLKGKSHQELLEGIALEPEQHGCSITLKEVAAFAMSLKVEVICADPKILLGASRLNARNIASAELINGTYSGGKAGDIFLWGGDHFVGGKNSLTALLNLVWVDATDDPKWHMHWEKELTPSSNKN
ncbi:hypothetical protein QYE80_13250 [Pseudomonas tohonis]|uniref:hypothetical protein n=1 Tax=Pseudomonas sp. zfem005 TaxID=3078200 RepID=UPI00146D14B5|nr:hypothetical protein [Pseudomonas sp. zfem005]MDN4145956.1 hypothetical protein [Pseudomonas tohonis]MDU9415289.1 hypothetical protein [Pseudomonas sp. zfem005]